jgi:carboxypeptidase Taq
MALNELKEKLRWISHFNSALSLLHWDMETHMPKKGGKWRAEIIGTLSEFVQRESTSEETGKLIYESEKEAKSDIDKALVRVAKKEYEKFKKVPSELWGKFAFETAKAQRIWEEAKMKSDFSIFAPQLEKVLEIVKEIAERVGYKKNRYDALLDFFEPGLTVEDLDRIIPPLREFLSSAIEKIEYSERPRDVFKEGKYDLEKQRELSKRVLEIIGYDFEAGRIDTSSHPFTTTISHGDVRVTTRYDESDLKYSFFSTVHEGGHALYEQGIPEEMRGLPIGDGASMGIHESQSRFWENIVARSLPFWRFFKPVLEEYFESFKKYSPEDLWKASNIVERSLIRTESDEVTYNLHIVVRYEIEKALINEEMKVKDIPAVWNEKMEKYIGVKPERDSEGALQDIHWSHGSFGYFPSYMLGNLYAAQIFSAMKKDLDFERLVEAGKFPDILNWLREKIHTKGRTLEPKDLLKEVTGEELNVDYFISYIREKYSKVYGVNL